jgi:DNA polymerase-3 subunit epsilon/ATP-dependent DNA helicase DinG
MEAAEGRQAAQGQTPLTELWQRKLEPPPSTPRSAVTEATPLDPEELAALLEPGGVFASSFDGYEHRSQQVRMLRAVANALSNSGHLLVEAGTGTGKSLAYLLPAFKWADVNQSRVLVSTNTINLQDQLSHKDIPTINKILGTDYQAAVLKGRGNYICPRRLEAMRHLRPRSTAEMRVLAKILVWLSQGGSGDRNEINLNGSAEAAVWSRLSAEGNDCSPETCRLYGSTRCPYFEARTKAETAHLIIVNHALLLADIATGNRVIPEFQHLIVDEAHHLESATTRGLSFRVTEPEFRRIMNDLGAKDGGVLQDIIAFLRSTLPEEEIAQVEGTLQSAMQRSQECLQKASGFFKSLETFMSIQREDKPIGRYGQVERILPSTRTLPGWTDVEISWENLRQPLVRVVQESMDMGEGLVNFAQEADETAEDLGMALRAAARNLKEVFQYIDELIFEPEGKMIYWLEISGNRERLSLHAAPLEIGHLVERFLWHQKESIIMTSATLTTAGDFDYIRQRLYALDAEELLLDSPFDFETSTLLYLIDNIPEPYERRKYQHAVEDGLIRLCRATMGRTLVLFTSYQQLRRTARSISDTLAKDGIFVFEQGEGASRHALLETFRTSEHAVLLGTRSFWEGVDVPGRALSVLVIVRLPFDVPSDPIVAARAETYEHSFSQYTIPEAILRFRQGFGRLIRTRSDRGVVAVFDRRLLSKSYGQAFVNSLPRCTVRVAPMHELPKATVRWLGD